MRSFAYVPSKQQKVSKAERLARTTKITRRQNDKVQVSHWSVLQIESLSHAVTQDNKTMGL
jgi:hypothetical protein